MDFNQSIFHQFSQSSVHGSLGQRKHLQKLFYRSPSHKEKLTLVIMPGSLAMANPFSQRCVIWAFLIRYDGALLQECKPIIVRDTDLALLGFPADPAMLVLAP